MTDYQLVVILIIPAFLCIMGISAQMVLRKWMKRVTAILADQERRLQEVEAHLTGIHLDKE